MGDGGGSGDGGGGSGGDSGGGGGWISSIHTCPSFVLAEKMRGSRASGGVPQLRDTQSRTQHR